MLDTGNALDEIALQRQDYSEAADAQDYGGISTWDYGAEETMRLPQSTEPWAVQQFMTPGATYDFGLNASDGTWSDISLSEFLKSPSPIPQVRVSVPEKVMSNLT